MVIEEKHGERCAAALTEALAVRQPPHCPAAGRVPAAEGSLRLLRREGAERLGGTGWAACAALAGLKPVVRTHESNPNATGHDPADHRSNDRVRAGARYSVDPFHAARDYHRIGPGPGGE